MSNKREGLSEEVVRGQDVAFRVTIAEYVFTDTEGHERVAWPDIIEYADRNGNRHIIPDATEELKKCRYDIIHDLEAADYLRGSNLIYGPRHIGGVNMVNDQRIAE